MTLPALPNVAAYAAGVQTATLRQCIPVWVAADAAKVKVRTVYKWIREGRLTRYPEGVDAGELLTFLETGRNVDALLSRAGMSFAERRALSDPSFIVES